MTDSIQIADENEPAVVVQALETYRALRRAVETAPQGKGLATVEAVVRDKGLDHLSTMLRNAVAEHPAAQKKGSAVCVAAAAARPVTAVAPTSSCSRRWG